MEEARVIVVVYTAVLLPLIIYFFNKSKIPSWVPSFYIIAVIVCALGWEIWFTFGWLDGDPVDIRRSAALNTWLPKNINWLMNSMGDAGAVLLGGFWLMWLTHNKDNSVFLEWKWSAFIVLLAWCIGQNILVEMFLYHDQLAEGKPLSWAPLSPLGPYFNPILFEFNNRTIMLQSQMPWLILPWFFYMTLINLNKSS
ncbi:MAG: hypothetical protein ACJ0FJ_02710 [Gammaproteobacteria bacterium]|nr:hypothetical protein [Gammaproteobacteria bacterium]